MKEFIYRKGDVFLADLGIPHGSEQGGRRPVVIIQNDDGCVYSPTVTMVTFPEVPLHSPVFGLYPLPVDGGGRTDPDH